MAFQTPSDCFQLIARVSAIFRLCSIYIICCFPVWIRLFNVTKVRKETLDSFKRWCIHQIISIRWCQQQKHRSNSWPIWRIVNGLAKTLRPDSALKKSLSLYMLHLMFSAFLLSIPNITCCSFSQKREFVIQLFDRICCEKLTNGFGSWFLVWSHELWRSFYLLEVHGAMPRHIKMLCVLYE